MRLRSHKVIYKLNKLISQQWKLYHIVREAMVALGASEDDLSKYQVITRKDLQSSTAMHDPNAPGLSNAQLSWIWLFLADGSRSMVGNECESEVYLLEHAH